MTDLELDRQLKKQTIALRWSYPDNAWIAEAPCLPGCSAHGDTPEDAVCEIQDAIKGWLETLNEDGPDLERLVAELKQEIKELKAQVDTLSLQTQIMSLTKLPESCVHVYPAVWMGTVPPSCEKCGKLADELRVTY